MTTDKEETDTRDSAIRYIGYTARIKTILFSAKRYLAYSSDFGEAFRPVVRKSIVNLAYGVSWLYVTYDVSNEAMRVNKLGASPDQVGEVAAKRLVFQSLASMALPAFTIHTQVYLFQKLTKKIGRFQRWGPTIAGLAVVPLLPFMFDEPVEHAVDTAFDKLFEMMGRKPFKHEHNEHK